MSGLNPCSNLLVLPSELLTLVFEYLWEPQPYGCHQSLLSVSKTCKTLRQVAIPILFSTVVCHTQEDWRVYHHALDKLVEHQSLLHHVRTLCVRYPVPREDAGNSRKDLGGSGSIPRSVPDLDLDIIKRGIAGMTQLRVIR
jgi:hypothetical protein